MPHLVHASIPPDSDFVVPRHHKAMSAPPAAFIEPTHIQCIMRVCIRLTPATINPTPKTRTRLFHLGSITSEKGVLTRLRLLHWTIHCGRTSAQMPTRIIEAANSRRTRRLPGNLLVVGACNSAALRPSEVARPPTAAFAARNPINKKASPATRPPRVPVDFVAVSRGSPPTNLGTNLGTCGVFRGRLTLESRLTAADLKLGESLD